MNKHFTGRLGVVLLAAATGLMVLGTARADRDWSTGATYAFSSQYLWRGMVQTSGHPVLQPAAYLSANGLTVSYWGNQDLGGMGAFSEVDLGLDWTVKAWDWGGVNAGLVTYWFPGGDPANLGGSVATEAYAALGLSIPASPKITVYQDLAKSSLYASLSLGQSFDLLKFGESGSLGLSLAAALGLGSAGHNTAYYLDAAGAGTARPFGFTDGLATISVPVALGPVTLTGSGGYAHDFMGVNGGHLFGGLTVGYSY